MRALALALAVTAGARAARAEAPPAATQPLPTVVATYAHDLSTPNGVVPLTWASLAHDRARSETFVVSDGFVRIFDVSGMEVHRFGDDGSLGHVDRAAVLENGGIVVLTTLDGKRAVLRCDFRGELVEPIRLAHLPAALDGFEPDQLVHRGGRLYLAERGTMRVAVTDLSGEFREAFQLRDLVAAAVPADAEQKPAASMDAFNVDGAGNLLFTMSTMFAAGIVTPAREVRLFGSRGSRPGRFNNVGGIDADERGNLFVTDRLRSVVSVWNRELRHLGDFGYRGDSTSNLTTPFEIAVGNGNVFVAQAGKRGVRVFRVQLVEPAPPPPAAPEQPQQPERKPWPRRDPEARSS